jgi:hypothetical protein
MLLHKSLPKQADIFKQSNKSHFYKISYKSFIGFKKLWILINSFILIFGITILLVPAKQVTKAAQTMSSCPQQTNNGNGCNKWWNSQNGNQNGNYYPNNDGDVDNNGNGNSSGQPFTPFPSNNFAVNTAPFTPIQQQQSQTIATTITPEPSGNSNATNQSNGQDIASISNQIIQVQQQIAGAMQNCVNNAQSMAQQVSNLQTQQNNLQKKLDGVNNQPMPNFDTSTSQGQQQQQAWQQQQQQQQQTIQGQIDSFSTAISNAQNTMNTANSNCQQNVSQLEQNRSQLEQNLDQTFSTDMNNAMNPPTPSPSQ